MCGHGEGSEIVGEGKLMCNCVGMGEGSQIVGGRESGVFVLVNMSNKTNL